MSIVIGVWFALTGLVAVLPWLGGMSRRHRLRGAGRSAWATVVPTVPGPGEAGPLPARRVSVQFTLDDGRIIERPSPGSARKSSALNPGQKVLVWYDPADPGDILVYGRDGRVSEEVLLLTGLVLITIGLIVATAP
jgi:hypothetical protein